MRYARTDLVLIGDDLPFTRVTVAGRHGDGVHGVPQLGADLVTEQHVLTQRRACAQRHAVRLPAHPERAQRL